MDVGGPPSMLKVFFVLFDSKLCCPLFVSRYLAAQNRKNVKYLTKWAFLYL